MGIGYIAAVTETGIASRFGLIVSGDVAREIAGWYPESPVLTDVALGRIPEYQAVADAIKTVLPLDHELAEWKCLMALGAWYGEQEWSETA
jgi:hypothetical protein